MSEWIKVSRKRPPVDTSVIVWGPTYIHPCESAMDRSGEFYSTDSGACVSPRPTHWQPMPVPPHKAKASES